jgi:hypothetical protein
VSSLRAPRGAALGAALAVLGWMGLGRAQSATPTSPAAPDTSAAPAGPANTGTEPADSATYPAGLLSGLEGPPLESGETPMSAAETLSGLAIYGFADFGFYKYFLPAGSLLRAQVYEANAFMVGNLNTYLAGELGGGWRSLAEVRFTYLPNGSRNISATGVERVVTPVQDYTNLGRPRSTGSLFIERAWVEYSASNAFNVRAGSWLTPYGIWNEDHGSPTIIPVLRPYAIGLELLPERQTGLLLFGSFYASESVTLGYRIGLSNGRGPVSDYADLDENKAVTLRLQLHHHGDGDLDLGASAYAGRYTDLVQSLRSDDGISVQVEERLRERFDEFSWALDARYVNGGLHLQTEFIMNDKAYTDGGRPLRTGAEFQPDDRRYGGYLLAGYRFDWLGLMPYLIAEYFSLVNSFEITRPADRIVTNYFGLGLNSRPSTNITLKLEGNYAFFTLDNREGSVFEDPLMAIQAQVAWAF